MPKVPTAITGRLGRKNRNKLALRKSEDRRREALSMVLSSMRGFNPGVEAKVEEVQQIPEVEEIQQTPGVEEPSQEKAEVEQVVEQVVEESQEPEQVVEESQEPQGEEGVVAQTRDWASLSKNELMEEAKSAGLKVKITTSKTELIELLTQNG